MNRETKRIMKKQQAQAERERVRAAAIAGSKQRGEEKAKEGRIKRWMRFLREVRFELKKVSWPNRSEIFTYTVVVVVTVTVLTAMVFVLDFAFANTILEVFK
jgi:preprotein translocase subunit SecE